MGSTYPIFLRKKSRDPGPGSKAVYDLLHEENNTTTSNNEQSSFSHTPPVLHHHYPHHQPHPNGTVGRVPHNHAPNNAALSSNTNSYPQPHPWVRNSVGNTAAAFGLYPTTNPSSRHQQKVCPSSGRCGRKGFVASIGNSLVVNPLWWIWYCFFTNVPLHSYFEGHFHKSNLILLLFTLQ